MGKNTSSDEIIKLVTLAVIGTLLLEKAGKKGSKKLKEGYEWIKQRVKEFWEKNIAAPVKDFINTWGIYWKWESYDVFSILEWLIDQIWKGIQTGSKVDVKIELYPNKIEAFVEGEKLGTLPLKFIEPLAVVKTPEEALEEEKAQLEGRQTEGTWNLLVLDFDGYQYVKTQDGKSIMALASMIDVARQFVVLNNMIPNMTALPLKIDIECKNGGNVMALWALVHYLKASTSEITQSCAYEYWDRNAEEKQWFGAVQYQDNESRWTGVGTK